MLQYIRPGPGLERYRLSSMKTALALLALLLPAFAADSPKADKDILATLDTWKQAMLKGDATTLDKLYHKDLAYTHSSAKTETKSESIANATKPGSVYKALEYRDLVTHAYGNTAIVKGKFDITNGAGALTHLDVLMVWIKSPQGWQLVARQAVKLP
jgi:ketosteroid isomerase-like protein